MCWNSKKGWKTSPPRVSNQIKHMHHGPCGEMKEKKSLCMVNGKCRFHYPRPYSSNTMQGKDAYPIYRRRNDGTQVSI